MSSTCKMNGFKNTNGFTVSREHAEHNGRVNGHKHRPLDTSDIQYTDDLWYTYEDVSECAKFLLAGTKIRPKIGIICGSGLGDLANNLTQRKEFTYSEIPHFPESTVPGHAGKLVFGLLNNIEVMCMQGRVHPYEGYPLKKCAMPVRVMKLVGVECLIATNAAGGLGDNINTGDIMIIKDHVNFMGFAGNNPLIGRNDDRFGPRFPPMNKAYDKELIKAAMEHAKDMKIQDIVKQGVYTCLGGPNYETIAELKCLSFMGVDAVGMSTVHEVITARHCGLRVFAFSLITNKCVIEYDSQDEPSHEEVVAVASERSLILQQLVSRIVKTIHETYSEITTEH